MLAMKSRLQGQGKFYSNLLASSKENDFDLQQQERTNLRKELNLSRI
jgi:hypothetical protein